MKERLLATDETGDDYESCELLRKNLANTTNHMKADEDRMGAINDKAKLLHGIRSELADDVTLHLRMLNSRWENLKGLASSRKSILDKSAKIHFFGRRTEEVTVRMKEKVPRLNV